MRAVLLPLLACAWLTACDKRGDARTLAADSAAGDVPVDSALAGVVYRGEKYPLTSDNYRRWLVAQAALDSLPEPADVPRIDVNSGSDEQIDRTIDFLSRRDTERQAIERSGLSVKDFVLTSLALGRMVRVASRDGDTLGVDGRGFAGIDPAAVRRTQERSRFRVVNDEEDREHEDEHDEDDDGGRAERHHGEDRHGDHDRGRKRGHGRGRDHDD